MVSVTSFNNSTGFIAKSVIDYVDKIKNTEIDDAALGLLKASVRSLVDIYNKKFSHILPLEIAEISIDDVGFEVTNAYHSHLKFSDMKRFVTGNLTRAENQDLYIDALCVLVSYCNTMIFSRFNYGFELKEKTTLPENR